MRTLCVVCPVYNEAAVIARFHAALAAVLDGLRDRCESRIIYVLDRSRDNSLEILKGIAAADPRVRVLALSARFGHQMSLLAGIDHADAEAVVMLDSDLQHPPELIPKLLDEFERGHDIVYTIREDSPDIGFFKRATSRLFYRLVNFISDIPIDESAADYRLISRKVARVFQDSLRERNQFVRGLVSWMGFNRVGVPFTVQPRADGASKYSLRRLFRFAAHGVVSFSRRPLQAAIFVGFAFAGLGLLLAAMTLVEYFRHAQWPSGWATLVMLISIFSGVQLIFLGIIGEYIGAIFDEVKARPHYLVDEDVASAQARSAG